MKWTPDTGELVTWEWSKPRPDEPGEEQEPPYPIGIHIDGRRLRGAEAKRWKQRIEAEMRPGEDPDPIESEPIEPASEPPTA